MSWSIQLVGTKSDVASQVKAQLVDNGSAPEIGAAILAEIAAMPDQTTPGGPGISHVIVIGSGHKGSGFGTNPIYGGGYPGLVVAPLFMCQPALQVQPHADPMGASGPA